MKLARLKKKTISRGEVAAAPDSRPRSVVGSELAAHGRLEASGELHIHGTVIGEVHAAKVVLCRDGFVEGTIVADEAILEGWLRGRVAAFRVTVEGTAVIEGSVFHHELTMEPGARFDGRTPWRPVNWFEDISAERILKETPGEPDEHVRA